MEVIGAAHSLGMNPHMKGSAAFAGLKYSGKPQMSDFFGYYVNPSSDVLSLQLPDSEPVRLERSTRVKHSIESPLKPEKSDGTD
jgi:hypothetical protein